MFHSNKFSILTKMFFMFIIFFSTMISISANSWMGCWIGLEINLMAFIPIIIMNNNLLSSEASLKYFLIQSISSINFLFIILIKIYFFNIDDNNLIMMLMNSSLLMKMGSAPFHFWFPNIIDGLTMMNCFILMTWQKITPMILLSYYFNMNFLLIIVIMNAIIGVLGGVNQSSLRKILAFSSINNLSWMIMSIMISENLWLMYFSIYSLMIFFICMFLYLFNMMFFNQIFMSNMKTIMKMTLFINLLSLGGLPPFLGFLPKWVMINFLMMNNFQIINFILIMMSLVMLFFYLRITFSSILFNHFKSKWFKMKMNYKNMTFIYFSIYLSLLGLPISTMIFIY
uniref:NADH-ubiquinone oxidoreductase chain 2 n=1 Tax=Caloptilia theivora TaxID=914280 RepID=A0A6G6CE94_9NEOP|nr:NADH dehydrogenase subunit 2 [Caloptilia theivora]QID90526.1 NADH dehydrogenase subunit 2 [Caloptilia theivora]